MHIAHINKDKKFDKVDALAKVLAEKWARRDKARAEKKYGKQKDTSKTA